MSGPLPVQKVLALSGGVGGAKLALGLSKQVSEGALSVIVNTADDFEHLGFYISPDIDTLMYTLGGVNNRELGWGRTEESWTCLDALSSLGVDTWFKLGDKDLAVHIIRTARLAAGDNLTSTTAHLARRFRIATRILPMSNDPVRTIVETSRGAMDFQRYFVKERCEPAVTSFRFAGIERAQPSEQVKSALAGKNLSAIIICPSNPFVSVEPIIALEGMRDQLRNAHVPVIAVSPIVGGQALKGPAAKMFRELGIECSPVSIAKRYADFLDGLIIDERDADMAEAVAALGVAPLVRHTIMTDDTSKAMLAKEALKFADCLRERSHA